MSDFITGLPKCELHVHLEGTLEADMAAAMASRHGAAPGAATERAATYDGLAAFLDAYYQAMEGLQDEHDFYELARAYLAKAHAQGVVYAEMFFDPQAHTSRGVAFDAVVTGIRRAQQDARASGGPETNLIMCFLRDHSAASAEATLDSALPYLERGWILGVGLDSDERGNPPSKFSDVFERARSLGCRVTMHCDPRQENSVAHLWECVQVIGVERIDHGVDCVEDAKLIDELARRRIGLTVCPLSNLRLYDTLMADEITHLTSRGVLVSLNSDDPAYFGGYLAENYAAVQEAAQLTYADLAALAKNSFEIAWLDASRRREYLSMVDEHLAAAPRA